MARSLRSERTIPSLAKDPELRDVHLCSAKNGIRNYTVHLLRFLNEGTVEAIFAEYHKGII